MSLPAPEEHPSVIDEVDLRATLRGMALGLLGLMALIGLVAWFLLDAFKELGAWFVRTLGPAGVALGFFLPDAFTLPVPHEGIAALAVAGGMNFWLIGASACVGSLVGGSVGWWLGKTLSGSDLFHRVMGRQGPRARAVMLRYGDQAVIIGAVTPIPYSIMAWSAGALGMPYRRFAWLSLWRIPRVFFYLALIKLGFIGLEA